MRPEEMKDISELSSKEISDGNWTGIDYEADIDEMLKAVNVQLEPHSLIVNQAWRGDDFAWIRVEKKV